MNSALTTRRWHVCLCVCLSVPGLTDDERVAKTMDKLSVNFGVEILTLVKGYVSTEVDARLSFDTEATLERAHNIIALYEAAGETRNRGHGHGAFERGERDREGEGTRAWCFRGESEMAKGREPVADIELAWLGLALLAFLLVLCCFWVLLGTTSTTPTPVGR